MAAPHRSDRLRPRKRPVQGRSRRTVDAVLRGAAQVFAKRGYAGATTNHIAERAGVSIGSLYEYFPNKDALLVALMERHVHEGEAVLERAAAEIADTPLGLSRSVRHLVCAMVDFHAHERALHRMLFEEAPLPPRVRHMLAELEERVAPPTLISKLRLNTSPRGADKDERPGRSRVDPPCSSVPVARDVGVRR